MDNRKSQFLRALVEDVEHALALVSAHDDPSDMRNALRSIVAAIEGVSWFYRTHVLSIARELTNVSPMMELAFSEQSVYIRDDGRIGSQPRIISTLSMIRLASRTAMELCPDFNIDFSTVEWQMLKNAIAKRNQITHPKEIDDLQVTNRDLEAAKTGFMWLFALTADVMERTQREMATHTQAAKEILRLFKEGDPDTLALFERVHRDLED